MDRMRRDQQHTYRRSMLTPSPRKSGLRHPRHTDGSTYKPRSVRDRGTPTRLSRGMESRAPDWHHAEMDQTSVDESRDSGKALDPDIQRSLRSNIANLQRKGQAIVRALRSEPCHTAQEHHQQLVQLKQAQVMVIAYSILLRCYDKKINIKLHIFLRSI